MGFEHNGKAEVVDVRMKRGTAEKAELKLFVRLRVTDVGCKSAAAIFGADKPSDLESALFQLAERDKDKNPLFFGLTSIRSSTYFENLHRITLEGLSEVRLARVGHFVLIPRPKATFDVDFEVQIEGVPKGYIDRVGRMLNESCMIHLIQDSELDLKGGEQPAEDPRPGARSSTRGATSRAH